MLHRRQDRLLVERPERPQVDDLDADPLLRHDVRRLEGVVGHQPVGDDRDLRAGMRDRRLAERHEVLVRRDVAADRAVHLLVLEEQDRVVVADGRSEQARGVVGRRRDDDLEARHVGEERLDRLRVVQRAVDPAAVRRADGHRDAEAVVRAVAHPRRLGHELVERRMDEVGELDLGDRAAGRSSPRRSRRR